MALRAQALVFDFDGVIADTEPLHWRAWAEVLHADEIDFDWNAYCAIGRGVPDEKMLRSLSVLFPQHNLGTRLRPRLTERKDLVRRWCSSENPIVKANAEIIKSLGGYELGLVTSSERKDVEGMLRQADIFNCFSACVFGDEVRKHKPDPEPYCLMREKLGIQAGIAFEDSQSGLQSARSAGFMVIHVLSPNDLPKFVRRVLERNMVHEPDE